MKRTIKFLVGVAVVVTLMVDIAASSGFGPGDSSSAEAGKGDHGKGGPGLRWNGIN